MLELIISLLIGLGIELNDGTNINVIDQQTGISYGVGTTVVIGQSSTTNPPTATYSLEQDENGKYYLVRR